MTVAAHAARTALLGLVLTTTLAACTAAPGATGPPMPTPPAASSPSELPRASAPPDPSTGTTAIRIVAAKTVLQATLWESSATRSLVDQLPLTLPLKDFARQEKISTPPHPLSMDGMPTGDDPEPLDIGYFAPDGVLVN